MNNSAKILIVDDSNTNRTVLHQMIKTLGYSTILADNGLSALSKTKKQVPDLVLLDILMPGMDGYEVLNRIKKDSSQRNIPVIVISAIDDVKSVAQCIEKGAEDYLVKPFNPTLLKARIGSCLEKKRLQDQEEDFYKKIEEYNITKERIIKSILYFSKTSMPAGYFQLYTVGNPF